MQMTVPSDWRSVGTLIAMAEWLRRASGALCVLVVRVEDATLAVDPGLKPAEALELIHDNAPGLALELEQARKEKRAARLVFDDGHE